MVAAYNLVPSDGSLLGTGLRLDFQTEEGRYRVDFLADQWLVIEIDGAAYHSSPEAIARDQARDKYFESLGYSVLRIPAKVVFNRPLEAVCLVRSALHVGKRVIPVVEQKGGFERLSDTLAAANDFVRRAQALERVLKGTKEAFESEKRSIESAVASAQQTLRTEDLLSNGSEDFRNYFNEAYTKHIDLLSDCNFKTENCFPEEMNFTAFPPSLPPHEYPEYEADIAAAYLRIKKVRTEFLSAHRLILESDLRLTPIVERNLKEYGCEEYFRLLTNIDESPIMPH